NHHTNGLQANDALTINLDQSDEAAQALWRNFRLQPMVCRRKPRQSGWSSSALVRIFSEID
ncbi:hypothetical protein, partial [Ruegeria atlantica]|uniref:hypothetical protein n=1 Tax=Ruegeria atlantica TaxID=81569 RepID=UPI002493FB50